jgi:hypothetical protein
MEPTVSIAVATGNPQRRSGTGQAARLVAAAVKTLA